MSDIHDFSNYIVREIECPRCHKPFLYQRKYYQYLYCTDCKTVVADIITGKPYPQHDISDTPTRPGSVTNF